MAFALAPEPPVADWLDDLDGAIARSPGFFVGRPAVLDLAGLTLPAAEIVALIAALETRGIRIMGLEGAAPGLAGPDAGLGLPPVLTSGRAASNENSEQAKAPPPAASLMIDLPVRSGQTIYHPGGDVIILGAVSSGAEVVAGGSIHVYGTLRGRAMAGADGDMKARIFCRRIDAELLAIAGYYRTVDDLEPELRSKPVQAWLDGETMLIAAFD